MHLIQPLVMLSCFILFPSIKPPYTSKEKQPAPLKNKDALSPHETVCYKDGDRRGGAGAPGLLTGQLEGANLLSELNIPDRMGAQQGGRASGAGKRMERSPTGAPC